MLKVINPATGNIVTELATDTAQTIARKFEQALMAQYQWKQTRLDTRIDIIKKFSELMQSQRDRLAQIQTIETGKPISQSINELKATEPRIGYFLENVESAIADIALSDSERISFEPLGVVANISAWNYPWFVGTNVYIPALLTGNAVLYKPSELCPQAGQAAADLMAEAGLPEGLFQCIIGDGQVGAELFNSDINGVYFTGSYPTGVKISQAAANKLIRVQLELGGKDPVYVCEDVDVKAAAEGLADGAFYNTGQSCCSVERLYVHHKIYDEFVQHFVETVKSFKIGDPTDKSTYIGPLTRAQQIAILNAQVTDALDQGAKLECGGNAVKGPGNYFEPTVFSYATCEMRLMQEESFGPIIGIEKASSDESAIELMNDTEFGLTAGVYTKNKDRAHKILGQLNSGTVYWNCCDRVNPRLPWTGRKHSGIGSTLSKIGIQSFVQPKAWHLNG